MTTVADLAARVQPSRVPHWPPEGVAFPVETPAGTVLYRVVKASAFRVVLMPCTPPEAERWQQGHAAAVHRAFLATAAERTGEAITAAATAAQAPTTILRRLVRRVMRRA
jgi:hypothetical protein